MSQPVEAMQAPWGPFANQCDRTRVSHATYRWRMGETEVSRVYETCVGFSATPSGHDAADIKATFGKPEHPSPTAMRTVRDASGVAGTVLPGGDGLHAQGPDARNPEGVPAGDIGLTVRQVVTPNDTVALPVHLAVPFPLDMMMSCRPDGEHRDHGRHTLVLSCTLDQKIRTAYLDAQVRLAGVEEIDAQTGLRLSGVLRGHLNGRQRAGDDAAWRLANERLLYSRETVFE